jgi:hypothetical protein
MILVIVEVFYTAGRAIFYDFWRFSVAPLVAGAAIFTIRHKPPAFPSGRPDLVLVCNRPQTAVKRIDVISRQH